MAQRGFLVLLAAVALHCGPPDWRREGQRLQNQGDPLAALQVYLRQRAGRDAVPAEVAAARLLLRHGEVGLALAILRDTSRRAPDSAEIWRLVGWCALSGGHPREARAALARSVRLDQDQPTAIRLLGIVEIEAQPDEKTVELLRRASTLRARDPQLWLALGKSYERRGRWEDAEAAYRRCLELDPKVALAARSLALVLERRGRPDQAIALLQPRVEPDRGAPKIRELYILGRLLLARGRAAEGRAVLARYREHNDRLEAMLHEGRQRRTAMRGVLEALEAGELEIAAARLDATRVPFGDDPRLMLLEAELAWARGQPSRSVDLARRYGRVAPDSSQVRLVLAGYLHATGLDHLAAEELNAAIERRPFAAELRRLRIAVLEGTGAPAGVLARARAELATLTEIALPSESTRDRSTDQDRLYAVLRLIQLPSAAEQATMEGERIPPGPYD